MTSIDRPLTLTERCFDANLRVDRIVHLPAMLTADIDDDLFEWLTDDCAELLAAVLGVDDLQAALTQYGTGRDAQRETLQEAVAWKRLEGWIVESSTPEILKSKTGARRWSWGCYLSKTFYADTYEAALDQAFDWVDTETTK